MHKKLHHFHDVCSLDWRAMRSRHHADAEECCEERHGRSAWAHQRIDSTQRLLGL
jgi:hypothetical protein